MHATLILGLIVWAGQMEADAGFQKVDRFSRMAHFVGKDTQVWILDVTDAGEPKPGFQFPGEGEMNSQISTTKDGEMALVSDGKAVYRVDMRGGVQKVVSLQEARAERLEGIGENGQINWYFKSSPDDRHIYFVMLLEEKSYVCELDMETRRLRHLEFDFPAGIDVDFRTGAVFVPTSHPANSVLIQSFGGGVNKRLAVSRGYSFCNLSPDGLQLLLSESDLDGNPSLSLLTIKDGKEAALPFSGAFATWHGVDRIFFVRGENSLWTYHLGDEKPRRLFSAGEQRDGYPTTGSDAAPVVLSKDRTWLSWCWTAKGPQGIEQGTLLVDLKDKKYRLLHGHWSNTTWCE